MSFGFGVGDFIAVGKLVNKLKGNFKDAPSELKSAVIDVKNLSNTVHGIEDFGRNHGLSSAQIDDLQDISKGCKDTLEALTKIVDNHCEVLTDHKRLSDKGKVIWKRLRLDPQEIRDVRERLTANVTLLNWFFGRLNSQVSHKTQQDVRRLAERDEAREKQDYESEILGWLSSADYSTQHADNMLVRQEGSGQWLLNSPEYKDWIRSGNGNNSNRNRDNNSADSSSSSNKILFCHGSPGSGKTIISSIVIDNLTTQFSAQHPPPSSSSSSTTITPPSPPHFCPSPSPPFSPTTSSSTLAHTSPSSASTSGPSGPIPIAYIFLNFKRQHTQKLHDLWSSLLQQLLRQASRVPADIEALYGKHLQARTRPSLRELEDALCSVLTGTSGSCGGSSGSRGGSSSSNGILVIDALDEYQVHSNGGGGGQHELVRALLSLQQRTGVRCFVTARPLLGIKGELEGKCKELGVRANEGDLRAYLYGQMARMPMPGVVLRDEGLREEIVRMTVEAVDGVFLLAKLHLESISAKGSKKQLRLALEKLPKGYDAYDKAYDDAMDRIRSQRPEFVQRAELTLSWIVCTKRPLQARELQHAMATEAGESDFDEDNIVDLEDTLGVCSGLVIWDKEADVVRMVHYTAQEYFERTLARNLPQGKVTILEGCLTYLNFDHFAGLRFGRYGFIRKWPFYTYAANYWDQHYLEVEDPIAENNPPEFLFNECKADNSMYMRDISRIGRTINGLGLCAFLGLTPLVTALLSAGFDPNHETERKQTPLHFAAHEGHLSVVQQLLAHPAVRPDAKEESGWTPLREAACNGHAPVVAALLELSPQNTTTGSTADVNTNTSIDIDINATDMWRWTPLAEAASNGHPAVVRLLLADPRIRVDAANYVDQRTPLSLAAANGFSDVVEIFLARQDVDADAPDYFGRAPLSHAAEYCQLEAVRLLLGRVGVRAGRRDKSGSAPLDYLVQAVQPHSRRGEDKVALFEMFVARRDVDVNNRDSKGMSPYLRAAKSRSVAILRMLVDGSRMADVVNFDAMDKHGRDALDLALEEEERRLPHPEDLDFMEKRRGEQTIRIVLRASGRVAPEVKNQIFEVLKYYSFSEHEKQVELLGECRRLLGREKKSWICCECRGTYCLQFDKLCRIDGHRKGYCCRV